MGSTFRCRRAWPSGILAALGALVLAATLTASASKPPSAIAQAGDGRYSVLVFSRTTGFRHSEAIDAGHAGIQAMGDAGDFDVTHSEDAGLFTNHGLRAFD